jgi:hypothetical protein
MTDRYCLYVECKKCRRDIRFKDVPEPKLDDPPIRSQSVQLKCLRCDFETVYLPSEMRLGMVDRPNQ